ncbi:MAG: hypothetical protein CHACPFDD_01056 [Phycisphaerae bacterium]|nr:hypothetical protein [Phycisphaerae bacterium]
MTKTLLHIGLFVLPLMVLPVAAAEDTLEDVQKRILEVWSRQKSLTAKVEMKVSFVRGPQRMDSTGSGTIEMLRKGDLMMTRSELKTTGARKQGEQEQKFETLTSAVDNGEFVISLEDSQGNKRATKGVSGTTQTSDVSRLFTALTREHNLKLLPNEKFGDVAVFVIEAERKVQGQFPVAKMVLSFSQDHGYLVRNLLYTREGDLLQQVVFSDFKLDADIPAERFTLEIPEGVKVNDMTQRQRPPAASQPAPPKP